eukprot:1542744-Pyramimonas_sp.AAC.1
MSEPAPEPAKSLFEAMQRAGASGPGVNLLESRHASMAVKPHDSLAGFFTERAINEAQSKQKLTSAKNMVYHREYEDVGSGLRLGRQDDREAWRQFSAAVPIEPVELH